MIFGGARLPKDLALTTKVFGIRVPNNIAMSRDTPSRGIAIDPGSAHPRTNHNVRLVNAGGFAITVDHFGSLALPITNHVSLLTSASVSGANPRRSVFSVTTRGKVKWSR
jgi:hypothetical protein